jgi:hypothetical protein
VVGYAIQVHCPGGDEDGDPAFDVTMVDHVKLRFREGVLLHEVGRLDESRRAYLDVRSMREERHFASLDRALTGFKARQKLAVVADNLGDFAEAERH